MAMEFSVGDKVVHPQQGPGQITGIESRGPAEEAKSYYVIDIHGPRGTLYVPVQGAGASGIRAAMSPVRLERVLSILGGKPHALPEDHRQRQQLIFAELQAGGVLKLVGVVRDLAGRGARVHLTQKDSEYLKRGRELLATEIALVSGGAVANASKLIDASMAGARPQGSTV
jgi:RNA polymerase-interacting CarD/CdnL/TRCF family regulator